LPPAPGGRGIVGNPQVALLSPHTLLLGAGTHLGPLSQGDYFARIRISSRERLHLDESYGEHGVQMAHNTGNCSSPPSQTFQRFTLWRGRPTAVGRIDRTCGASDADFDFKVSRLLAPAFGHGFE
jgi:hypothetical protein